MVFQDGRLYLDPEGDVRGGIVLDNLIHQGHIPVTLGVFVDLKDGAANQSGWPSGVLAAPSTPVL